MIQSRYAHLALNSEGRVGLRSSVTYNNLLRISPIPAHMAHLPAHLAYLYPRN